MPAALALALAPGTPPLPPRLRIMGLPASPGAACGKVAFTAEEAKERAEKGEKVVLVRLETSPEDITGMKVAQEGFAEMGRALEGFS